MTKPVCVSFSNRYGDTEEDLRDAEQMLRDYGYKQTKGDSSGNSCFEQSVNQEYSFQSFWRMCHKNDENEEVVLTVSGSAIVWRKVLELGASASTKLTAVELGASASTKLTAVEEAEEAYLNIMQEFGDAYHIKLDFSEDLFDDAMRMLSDYGYREVLGISIPRGKVRGKSLYRIRKLWKRCRYGRAVAILVKNMWHLWRIVESTEKLKGLEDVEELCSRGLPVCFRREWKLREDALKILSHNAYCQVKEEGEDEEEEEEGRIAKKKSILFIKIGMPTDSKSLVQLCKSGEELLLSRSLANECQDQLNCYCYSLVLPSQVSPLYHTHKDLMHYRLSYSHPTKQKLTSKSTRLYDLYELSMKLHKHVPFLNAEEVVPVLINIVIQPDVAITESDVHLKLSVCNLLVHIPDHDRKKCSGLFVDWIKLTFEPVRPEAYVTVPMVKLKRPCKCDEDEVRRGITNSGKHKLLVFKSARELQELGSNSIEEIITDNGTAGFEWMSEECKIGSKAKLYTNMHKLRLPTCPLLSDLLEVEWILPKIMTKKQIQITVKLEFGLQCLALSMFTGSTVCFTHATTNAVKSPQSKWEPTCFSFPCNIILGDIATTQEQYNKKIDMESKQKNSNTAPLQFLKGFRDINVKKSESSSKGWFGLFTAPGSKSSEITQRGLRFIRFRGAIRDQKLGIRTTEESGGTNVTNKEEIDIKMKHLETSIRNKEEIGIKMEDLEAEITLTFSYFKKRGQAKVKHIVSSLEVIDAFKTVDYSSFVYISEDKDIAELFGHVDFWKKIKGLWLDCPASEQSVALLSQCIRKSNLMYLDVSNPGNSEKLAYCILEALTDEGCNLIFLDLSNNDLLDYDDFAFARREGKLNSNYILKHLKLSNVKSWFVANILRDAIRNNLMLQYLNFSHNLLRYQQHEREILLEVLQACKLQHLDLSYTGFGTRNVKQMLDALLLSLDVSGNGILEKDTEDIYYHRIMEEGTDLDMYYRRGPSWRKDFWFDKIMEFDCSLLRLYL